MSAVEQTAQDIPALMAEIGRNSRIGANALKIATSEQKRTALLTAAGAINAHRRKILEANALDMQAAEEKGISKAFLDRLLLTDARIDLGEAIRFRDELCEADQLIRLVAEERGPTEPLPQAERMGKSPR